MRKLEETIEEILQEDQNFHLCKAIIVQERQDIIQLVENIFHN